MITVVCPDHGPFYPEFRRYRDGSGCPICMGAKKKSSEQVVLEFRKVHGDKYDYTDTVYVNNKTKVSVRCPYHGTFLINPNNHKKGYGCPKCGKRYARTREEWIEEFRNVHGDKYDYSEIQDLNSQGTITIVCKKHAPFRTTSNSHIRGRGCAKCSAEARGVSRRLDYAETLPRNVILVSPENPHKKEPATFFCDEHGEFKSTVDNVVKSYHGCPKCASAFQRSKAELELFEFVSTITTAEQSNRTLLDGKELDIYIPEHRLAIEYCGIYWHCEERGKDKYYHFDKWKKCKDRGIRLLTIFEDEDLEKVKNVIQSALGARRKGIFARRLSVREISADSATLFLNNYHLQGSCAKRVSYGAYDEDVLVSVMSFGHTSRQSRHAWELRRFCTDNRTHPGIASKLWNAFLRDHDPTSVVSLSDRRYFTGDMYEKLGFTWDGDVTPDYAYVIGSQRFHKSGFRKSAIKRRHPEIYDSDLTEREMMSIAGYGRIWDCGKDRWVWEK